MWLKDHRKSLDSNERTNNANFRSHIIVEGWRMRNLFLSELNSETVNKGKGNRDFPGGVVVKNLPANAGDTDSSPGPGRSHMPRSN